MLRIPLFIATGMLVVLPTLHAQHVRSVSFQVTTCPAADSLFGSQLAGELSRVLTNGKPADYRAFTTIPTGFGPGATGVVNLGASMSFMDTTLRTLPPAQLNLTFIGSAMRQLHERQLAFVIDDTLRIELGSMASEKQTSYSRETGIVENMAIVVPVYRLTQLSQAGIVQGQLGTTPFTVSEGTLRDIRSVLVAALCYSTDRGH